MSQSLNQDFADRLRSFTDGEVRFLIVGDLSRPGLVFQVGLPLSRIDVLTQIDGVSFAEAWPRRAAGRYEGLEIPVIGAIDLVANKRATGRTKDLADVEALEALLARRPRTP